MEIQRYAVQKTPEGCYRTWVARTGRYVRAYTFEDLLYGLRAFGLGFAPHGCNVEVRIEYRNAIVKFRERAGPAYALMGLPIDDRLHVHDARLHIDAVADTMLGLEQQLWYKAHSQSSTCPADYGSIELVYHEAFTLDGHAVPCARTHLRCEMGIPPGLTGNWG